jgi:DeoR family fructose operon transcriptional repressor
MWQAMDACDVVTAPRRHARTDPGMNDAGTNDAGTNDGVEVYAAERQAQILQSARSQGRVEVLALASLMEVTPETVRRDLTALERLGVLRRVHGGAMPVERFGFEPNVAMRENRFAAEKDRIAKAALDELPDGGSLIVDAGTTTIRLANLLPNDRRFTVVTHSIPVASALAAYANVTLHLLGGIVRGITLAAVGDWALRNIADVNVDVAFLGINGITAERGLTTPDLGEAQVKRAFTRAARRTVVLADHSKFGRAEFARVAGLDEIDTIITDSDLDAETASEIEISGPRVVRA